MRKGILGILTAAVSFVFATSMSVPSAEASWNANTYHNTGSDLTGPVVSIASNPVLGTNTGKEKRHLHD